MNVVDEFVVKLGLDPSGFNQGQRAASQAFARTREQAKVMGDDVEKYAKGMSDGIDRVTKSALALFGVLLGARSLGDFIANVTSTDAAVGRLATTMGISTQNLQAWQAAAERMGGSAAGMASSISTASNQIVNLRTSGTPLPVGIARIFAAAGMSYDPNWTTEQYLVALASAANKDKATLTPQTISSLLGQSGFTSDFTNLALAHGGAGLQGYLNSMPTVSPDTIRQMQETQDKWIKFQQTVVQIAATVVGDLENAFSPLIGDFQTLADILKKVEPFLKTVSDDIRKILIDEPGTRAAVEAAGAVAATGVGIGALKWAGRFFGKGAGQAATDVAASAAPEAASAGWLGAIGGVGSWALGRLGGPLAVWLANTTPAGAGEGDVLRKYLAAHPSGTAAPKTGGSRSWRNNNPGNIEYGPYAISMGATGSDGRFAVFPDYATGRKAMEKLLFESSAYGDLTLSQAISKYAPSTENDTSAYVSAVANGAHVDPNMTMSSASAAQRAAILSAMQTHEGWFPGKFSAPSIGLAHSSAVNNSSSVTINGPIHIHTQATDATGIAGSLHGALKRAAMVRPANTGMA